MLTEEQSQQMKSNIIQQIESTFPEDKKASAISQIESMSSEQLEEFIKQNSAQQTQNTGEGEQQCIFCLISSGKAQSYQVDENKSVAAVLELNPISKGHTLIIPKKHSDKIQKRTISFAEKISKKLKLKLKSKNIISFSGNLFGHEIINVVPVYQDENQNSQRYKAEKEELEEVQRTLTKKVIKKPTTKKIKEKKLWLPRRIP